MSDELTTERVAGKGGLRTVVALFPDRHAAERAVRALHDAGFSRDTIGVAMRDRTEQEQLIQETGSRAADGAAEGRHFERGVHAGGVLVTVDEPARAEAARAVLHASGGDLASARSGAGPGVAGAAPRADYTSTSGSLTGSTFDVAAPAVAEAASWSGIERRQTPRRGRRQADHL